MLTVPDLGDVMKRRRAALGLSQADLAEAAETTVRQVSRYESGETQPLLSTALKIADVLGVSVSELAGREPPPTDLGGDWWAGWQTFREGAEYVAVHELRVTQQGDWLQLDGSHRPLTVEEGGYRWRGELRLWHASTLMGYYVATDAAVRSHGTIYFRLHHHGLSAAGRWVGESFDGDLVSGFGAMARDRDEVERVVRGLIDQEGAPWIRSWP